MFVALGIYVHRLEPARPLRCSEITSGLTQTRAPAGRRASLHMPPLTRSCPSLGRFKLMISPGSVGGSTTYTRFGHNSWFFSPPAHFPNMLPKTNLLELLFKGMEISRDPGLNLRTNPKALDVWLSLSTCVI